MFRNVTNHIIFGGFFQIESYNCKFPKLQTTRRLHMNRKERRSLAQSSLRTQTAMAPLYPRTPQRYESKLTPDLFELHEGYI